MDVRTIINHWNLCVGRWLHDDVYVRFAPIGRQQGLRANLITYLISAFWHGFYPGYYYTFVTGAFVTIAEKRVWRRYRGLLDPASHRFIRLLRQILTHLLLMYISTPFLLLDGALCWAFWSSVYFYGHILVFLMLFVL